MSTSTRSKRAMLLAGLMLTAALLTFHMLGAPAAKGPDQSEYGMEVIRLVNEERAKVNLPPLAYEESLLPVAQLRAEEASRKFSHTRPSGEPWSTAFTEFGVSGHRGENLAYGQKNPERVVKAWMNSPGHRANILNDRYTVLAVGVYKKGGTIYWAQAFLGDQSVANAALVANVVDPQQPRVVNSLEEMQLNVANAQSSNERTPNAVYVSVKSGAELNLRAKANTKGKILCVMPSGTQLELLERMDGWVYVRMSDGVEGWCADKYLNMP